MVESLTFKRVDWDIKDCPDGDSILDVIKEIGTLLIEKNRAYGSSFRVSSQVFSKLDPVEGVKIRLDDKLARLKQAKDFNEDTLLDILGYLILYRVLLKEQAKPKVDVEAAYAYCNKCNLRLLREVMRNVMGRWFCSTECAFQFMQ